MNTFESFGLSETMLEALEKKGFTQPSPIQEQTIPFLLEGERDAIGRAQTGTGKTAAFGIPIIERLRERAKHVQAIILTPTRELAIQVSEELNTLKGRKRLHIAPFYGGQSIMDQMRKLTMGVDIVVGTPGRILDLIGRKRLDLSLVSFFVLDEADEMLNMGFIEDVEEILKSAREERTTLFFSATMPPEIRKMAGRFMKENFEVIAVETTNRTADLTAQIYYQVAPADKFEAMTRIVDMEEDFYGLVFCRTKVECDEVAVRLAERGYPSDVLHGDISQTQREKVLQKFRKRSITVLVATDVAARGIDISDLTHVVNYNLPQDAETYVHRIGRTGRAGKTGSAVSLVSIAELGKLNYIRKVTGAKIEQCIFPKVSKLVEAKQNRLAEELDALIEDGAEQYLDLAKSLLEERDAESVIAALIKHTFQDKLAEEGYDEIAEADPRQHKVRLKINLGRRDGMQPRKVLNMLKNIAGTPSRIVNGITIMDSVTLFTVSYKEAGTILYRSRSKTQNGKPLIEKALENKPGYGGGAKGKRPHYKKRPPRDHKKD